MEDAREERKNLLREGLEDRAINDWLEPVIGSIGDYKDGQLKDADGNPLFIRKFDNRLSIRVGEANLEEYAKSKAGGGDTNISVQANAAASAQASTVVITPEKLRDIQERNRQQLERQARRAATRRALEAALPGPSAEGM